MVQAHRSVLEQQRNLITIRVWFSHGELNTTRYARQLHLQPQDTPESREHASLNKADVTSARLSGPVLLWDQTQDEPISQLEALIAEYIYSR